MHGVWEIWCPPIYVCPKLSLEVMGTQDGKENSTAQQRFFFLSCVHLCRVVVICQFVAVKLLACCCLWCELPWLLYVNKTH